MLKTSFFFVLSILLLELCYSEVIFVDPTYYMPKGDSQQPQL
jgi:hypothetical protein